MKYSLAIVAFLLIVGSVHADGISYEYGARLAAGMTSFSQKLPGWGDADQKFKLGFMAGLFASITIRTQMELISEILYERTGGKFENSGAGFSFISDFALAYITVNLFLRYKLFSNFFLLAGPRFAFLLTGTEKYESKYTGFSQSDTYDIKKDLKSFELGLLFGFGYQFAFGLTADLRFGLGLTNIWDIQNYNMKNRVILLGFSYALSRLFSR